MGRLKKAKYYRIYTVPTAKGYRRSEFVAYSTEDAISLAKVLCKRQRVEAKEQWVKLPSGAFTLLRVIHKSSGKVLYEAPQAAELLGYLVERWERIKAIKSNEEE